MKLRAARLLIAVAVLLLPLACRDGSIYYTLENETAEPDLSLPNDVIVFDVALLGTSYYAAAGKVWTVPLASIAGGWDVNEVIPAPAAGALGTALVTSPFGTNDTLFGGFITASGNLGLYESSATPTAASTTWTPVADVDVSQSSNGQPAQVALLRTFPDPPEKLAVVIVTQPSAGADYRFSIVTSTNGTDFEPATITRTAGEELKPINDVLYSPTLGTWLFTEGEYLYSGPLTGMAQDASIDAKTTSGEVLYGLFDDGTNVYVSSWDRTRDVECAIYYRTAVSPWTRIAVPAESNGVHPPLTRFAGPLGTSGILLIGSDGYGYFRLDTTTLPAASALTRFPTTTSNLYPAAVRKFFLDAAANRVFACTALRGLWRGAFTPSDGSISWTQE